MPPLLRIDLFGPGTLSLDGVPVSARSAKTLALLACLAVEHGRPHARGGLAAMLWPAHDPAAARQSVRQALHSLRSLADGALAARIVVEGELVRFVPGTGASVDVHLFEDAAGSAALERWREAAELYRAPLLDGRAIDDAPLFLEWLESARARLQSAAMHNLDRLATDAAARGDPRESMRCAQRMRELDAAGELASRHLMRALAALGDAGGLETEWARLCDVLEGEFGASPTRETAALRSALLDGLAAGPVGAPGPVPAPASRLLAGASSAPRAAAADPLMRAARAAERLHAYGSALDLLERAVVALRAGGPASEPRLREALLSREGVLDRLGRRADQVATIDELVALADAAGDAPGRAAALLRRANACAYLGEHARAREAATEALRTFREAGERPGEAEALRELGFVEWRAGRPGEALAYAREALELHRALGDVSGEASALHNLGELHRDLGSPRQSLPWFERALALHWAAGAVEGEILTRFGLAHALLRIGDADGAGREYRAALAIAERHGERTMQSRALQALAARSMDAGDSGAALDAMRRAIDVDRGINYAHALGHDLVMLAWIHLRRGERVEARAALHEATVWFDYTGDAHGAAAALEACAELDAGRDPAPSRLPGETVLSHLPFAEGKVYCVFESPLTRAA